MSKYKVFNISVDCGRMGSLDGLYLADEEAILALNGTRFSAFDVFGKHSEVYFEWGEDEQSPDILIDEKWNVVDLDVLAASLSPSGESIIHLGGFDFIEHLDFEYDD